MSPEQKQKQAKLFLFPQKQYFGLELIRDCLGCQFERNEYKTFFRIITVWLEVTRLFCTCETIPNKSDKKLDFNVVNADHPINGAEHMSVLWRLHSLCKKSHLVPPFMKFLFVAENFAPNLNQHKCGFLSNALHYTTSKRFLMSMGGLGLNA